MSRRRALFRADASVTIGTGHLVRSRTLACELARRGWSVSLATRTPSVPASATDEPFTLSILIPRDVDVKDEPAFLEPLVESVTLCVTDHYGLGARWHSAAREWAAGVVAIDDVPGRKQDVDVLLNQNLGASIAGYRGLVPSTTRLLLGPMYALVRPEFAAHRPIAGERDGQIRRALVFISGADPDDVTRRAASGTVAAGIDVDVVVGSMYQFLDELRAWVSSNPRVRLHVNTDQMAELMARADVAVGAPGSASWERCTVGLPAVLVTVAENQIEIERELVARHAAIGLGWHAGVTSPAIAAAVRALIDAPSTVREMAAAAAAICDGRGASRVADELESLA